MNKQRKNFIAKAVHEWLFQIEFRLIAEKWVAQPSPENEELQYHYKS